MEGTRTYTNLRLDSLFLCLSRARAEWRWKSERGPSRGGTFEGQRRRRGRKDDRNDEVNNEEATRRRHTLSPPVSDNRYLDTAAMDCVNQGLVSSTLLFSLSSRVRPPHRLIPILADQSRFILVDPLNPKPRTSSRFPGFIHPGPSLPTSAFFLSQPIPSSKRQRRVPPTFRSAFFPV